MQRLMRLVRVSRVLIVWSTMLSLWTHYYRHALSVARLCPHEMMTLGGIRRNRSCPQYCQKYSAFQHSAPVYVYALQHFSSVSYGMLCVVQGLLICQHGRMTGTHV